MSKNIDRREFLKLTALTLAGGVLASCQKPNPKSTFAQKNKPPPTPEAPSQKTEIYHHPDFDPFRPNWQHATSIGIQCGFADTLPPLVDELLTPINQDLQTIKEGQTLRHLVSPQASFVDHIPVSLWVQSGIDNKTDFLFGLRVDQKLGANLDIQLGPISDPARLGTILADPHDLHLAQIIEIYNTAQADHEKAHVRTLVTAFFDSFSNADIPPEPLTLDKNNSEIYNQIFQEALLYKTSLDEIYTEIVPYLYDNILFFRRLTDQGFSVKSELKTVTFQDKQEQMLIPTIYFQETPLLQITSRQLAGIFDIRRRWGGINHDWLKEHAAISSFDLDPRLVDDFRHVYYTQTANHQKPEITPTPPPPTGSSIQEKLDNGITLTRIDLSSAIGRSSENDMRVCLGIDKITGRFDTRIGRQIFHYDWGNHLGAVVFSDVNNNFIYIFYDSPQLKDKIFASLPQLHPGDRLEVWTVPDEKSTCLNQLKLYAINNQPIISTDPLNYPPSQ